MEGGRGGDNEDYKDEAKQRDQEKKQANNHADVRFLIVT